MITRILHLTKYMPEFPGGIERATHTMAVAGRNLGARVKIIGATPRPEERIVSGEMVDTQALPIVLKIGPVPFVPGFFGLARQLDEADIVHIHLPNPTAELALLWYLRKRRTARIVPIVHAPIVRWPSFARLWMRWIHGALLKRSHAVIFQSPQLADYLGGYRKAIHPRPVHVLPYGVPVPPRFVSPADQPRAEGPIRLLSIGRLVAYKGFDLLLEAMSQVKQDWTLTIAGQGPEGDSLKRQVDRLGLTSRVQLIERIPDGEKHQLLSRCDLFVLPSQTVAESFGIVIGEAFAHGKAVVTTDLKTGVAFLARGGECGAVVPTHSPGRLADALEGLILDEARRKEAGRKNREFWKRELAPETFQRRYAQIVQQVSARSWPMAS